MNTMAAINLFCLPFAGGSKYSYPGFSALAASGVNVIPIDLPGRGSRMSEELLTNIELMADDVFGQIKRHVSQPYAIYGHSMGTLLGYLVTKRILSENLPPPESLFFTGAIGPSVRVYEEMRHLLPKEAFITKLKELGGVPDEVFLNDDLINFFEPVLRCDFQAVETYVYRETKPFSIPIVVIIGSEEEITLEEALAWQKETTYEVSPIKMKGHHFFIHSHEESIMKIIIGQLFNNIPPRDKELYRSVQYTIND